MKALVFGRTTVAKAGWLLVGFLIAWPLCMLLPFGKDESTPALPGGVPHARASSSKLLPAGLAGNPDWEGLPELFAVWAEQAEWSGNKTRFAYWNPGSNTYSYFFVASREDGNIRFRAITQKEAFSGQREMASIDLTEPASTHPFVFLFDFQPPSLPKGEGFPALADPGPAAPLKVPINLEGAKK